MNDVFVLNLLSRVVGRGKIFGSKGENVDLSDLN